MRGKVLLAAGVLILAATAMPADDKADRERRVRVALALAGGDAADACGQCRDDVDEARKDGLKENRPVVLFVGGCPGSEWAYAVKVSGGIPVKTLQYADGERPPTEKRTVILEPKPDRTGFLRVDVPAKTTAAELSEKVKASAPAAKVKPTPLNWEF